MAAIPLTPTQEAEAQRLYELLQQTFLDEARHFARLLASKPDHQQLGKTEFEVREQFHRLAAKALQTALNERKKGGTKAPAGSVRIARRMPAARASARGRSSAYSARCGCGGTTTIVSIATAAPSRGTRCWACVPTT
jgi:hypothetical protein